MRVFAIWQVVDVEAPKLCSRNSERCTRADVLAGVGKIRLAYWWSELGIHDCQLDPFAIGRSRTTVYLHLTSRKPTVLLRVCALLV